MAAYAPVIDHGDFAEPIVRPVYAWAVFALTVGLLLSDYMSRQTLNAVFPFLKGAWGLSDAELGSLSSIVALMVGVLTVPLSILADRWGRVRSITLMAALWSVATLGCAISTNYHEMLAARAFVGIGEAAYGSVGIALVLSIFPARLRSTLTSAFMAGGAFGSVLGVALGGVVATRLGWRWSFGAMAGFGFVLVLVYAAVVTENRLKRQRPAASGVQRNPAGARLSLRSLAGGLFSSRSVVCAYVGSGFHLFVATALFAWMPSYLNRYYAMAPAKAAVVAAGMVLVTGVGMIFCGIVTDWVSRTVAARKWMAAIVYCLISFTALGVAFAIAEGPLQMALIGIGMFFCAGASGPSGAMVARLTPEPIHASAFATLTLINNFLGLAPAAFVTGIVADRIGLLGALQFVPLFSLAGAVFFLLGSRSYLKDVTRLDALRQRLAT
ncbi:MAG: putative MFS-type transporter [Burkholderiaceae bacterium]|jgi:predicted MFS family arabinose efflux permease|nr:MAG: putative MFS-type transporter [Burkholderiaceae bacterium]